MDVQMDTSIREDVGSSLNSTNDVMAAGSIGTQGSVSAFLHPLVIMNISEHWTRLRAQEGSPQPVYGALIGRQKGRNIEIMNSFELNYLIENENVVINREFYNQKEDQFKQVFPDLDFLGWYTTGDKPNANDIHVHRQILAINESPVFLKLNPFEISNKLPIKMYESIIDLVNNEATVLFVEINYTLVTEEAERIGLDHMARLSTTQQSGADSVVSEHLRAQFNAVKMLRDRIKIIADYVKAMKNNEVAHNQTILREVNNLCHYLPVVENENAKFNESFYNQWNDVALIAYLGSLTKSSNSLNQFVQKFSLIYDKHQGGLSMNRRQRMY